MNRTQLERLLWLVVRTADEELSCTACFELLPVCADLEVAGQDPAVRLPLFRRHLEQCLACSEEYEIVLELVRLEAGARLPAVDDRRGSR